MADELWEELVGRAEGGDVTPGTMFGSQGLRTGKKFFAIWWHDQLVVKLPPDRLQELVAAGQAAAVRADGGPPHERLAPRSVTPRVGRLVEEARAFVASPQK